MSLSSQILHIKLFVVNITEDFFSYIYSLTCSEQTFYLWLDQPCVDADSKAAHD